MRFLWNSMKAFFANMCNKFAETLTRAQQSESYPHGFEQVPNRIAARYTLYIDKLQVP